MAVSNVGSFPILPNLSNYIMTSHDLSHRNPRFLDQSILEDGLDPVEYIKQVRTRQRKKKRRGGANIRKGYRNSAIEDLALSGSEHHSKGSGGPKAEFLIPETYIDDPPCEPGSSNLSGFTFMNFMMSAIALGANIVSNINNNQRNNNNNNNDNNDNVNNFNFASNNNAGNNQNTIAICPFPCIPGPPGIPTGMGRKKRRKRNQEYTIYRLDDVKINGLKIASNLATKILGMCQKFDQIFRTEEQDISLATILAIQFWQQISKEQGTTAFCQLKTSLENIGGLGRAGRAVLIMVVTRLAFNAFHKENVLSSFNVSRMWNNEFDNCKK